MVDNPTTQYQILFGACRRPKMRSHCQVYWCILLCRNILKRRAIISGEWTDTTWSQIFQSRQTFVSRKRRRSDDNGLDRIITSALQLDNPWTRIPSSSCHQGFNPGLYCSYLQATIHEPCQLITEMYWQSYWEILTLIFYNLLTTTLYNNWTSWVSISMWKNLQQTMVPFWTTCKWSRICRNYRHVLLRPWSSVCFFEFQIETAQK